MTLRSAGSIPFALFLGLATASDGSAQSPACAKAAQNTNDALVDLGKNAFEEAVKKGAERLGEKGAALAEAGEARGGTLIDRGSRLNAGATFIGNVDALILDPIKQYMESPSEEAAGNAFKKLLENAAKKVFPVAGVTLDAGRFVIGAASWTVEEMVDEGQRQQIETTIFGRGATIGLGRLNNLFADEPFFTSGPVTNRFITRDGFGVQVKSDDELRDLWFKYYGNFLKGGGLGMSPSKRKEVDDVLAEGWPTLQQFWAFKRTEAVVKEMQSNFEANLAKAHKQSQDAVSGACEVASAPQPAPAPSAPPPQGAHLVLESVTTSPPLTNIDKAVWKSVNVPTGGTSGSASYDLYGSTAAFTWSVPAYLDASPRVATISGNSKAVKNGYGQHTRLAFDISLGGSAKFDTTAPSLHGLSESASGAAKGEASVNVRAPSLAPRSGATITVGVNWAFTVTFNYVLAVKPPR